MSETLKTTNLDIFKKKDNNRNINDKNLKKIIDSINKRNLLHLRPILVDGSMGVIDGQHRLEAARLLNLPIYYVIDDRASDADMAALNSAQMIWSSLDYLHFYVAGGNAHYIRLKEYLHRNELPLDVTLSLLLRYRGASDNPYFAFRSGKFVYPADDKQIIADQITEVINYIKEKSFEDTSFLRRPTFLYSICVFLTNPNVNFELFRHKLESRVDIVRRCSSKKHALDMLKYIYNYRNQKPIA